MAPSSYTIRTINTPNIEGEIIDVVVARAFYQDACLYMEVLGIKRDASSREIRIAYFKKLRELIHDETDASIPLIITPDNSTNPQPPPPKKKGHGSFSDYFSPIGMLSDKAKLKFRAISHAYEILSNPSTKKQYDSTRRIWKVKLDLEAEQEFDLGWGKERQNLMKRNIKPNISGVIIEPNMSKKKSVRWDDNFEERVFICDKSAEEASTGILDGRDEYEYEDIIKPNRCDEFLNRWKIENKRRINHNALYAVLNSTIDEVREMVTDFGATIWEVEDAVKDGMKQCVLYREL